MCVEIDTAKARGGRETEDGKATCKQKKNSMRNVRTQKQTGKEQEIDAQEIKRKGSGMRERTRKCNEKKS